MDLNSIEIVKVESIDKNQSDYVKPMRLFYKQNGKAKIWDFIKTHNSVSILIYNSTRNVLVFVRQFRPPVYLSILHNNVQTKSDDLHERAKELGNNSGFTLELCAGIIDKEGLSPIEIAKEEVLEETGYDVPLESLQLITTYRTGVSYSGAINYQYFCQVSDEMRVNSGGGIGDESIEVIEYSLDECRLQMYAIDDCIGIGRTPGLRLAISWFFYEKLPSLQTC